MDDIPDAESGEIKVSSKTLGHISAGLYRSTSGALKELISNAFDADADRVRISMNPPGFDVVSVADNGTGIHLQKFLALMNGQIGDSDKRVHGTVSPAKQRPIIGRIGIGLLAISQICHSFEIVSHHKSTKTAFRARVQLIDYLRERIDVAETNKETYDIGRFQMHKIDYNERMAGTRIIATELRRVFVERFRQDYRPLPEGFDEFYSEVAQVKSLRDLCEYWRTTWQIALAAPLPYYDGGPVRGHVVDPERQQKLLAYDFKVAIDLLPLQRPVLLPPLESDQPPIEDTSIAHISIHQEVDGTPLLGSGYLYSQGGKSIYPAELRGVLVRIKNVAIGQYDRNFLDYPINEGPRIGWVSGELSIDDGLEDALNIDRDSFNETHPHYLTVQKIVHTAFDEQVKRWIFTNAKARRQRKSESLADTKRLRVQELFSDLMPDGPIIDHVPSFGEPDRDIPVKVDADVSRIAVNDAAGWPRARDQRDLAEQIAIAFELALEEPDLVEARRRFYSLWKHIFS
jgi:hypothetical protein